MLDKPTNRPDLPSEIARRRTFAIISHPDAGKTTLTEKFLLYGGAIQMAGQVRAKGEARRTRSDFMAMEKDRGISVSASAMSFDFGTYRFNLVDTPGHSDFSEDTYRTLTAVDAAVMVAAVADWRPRQYVGEKIKKRGSAPPALMLTENPDILTNLGASDKRPDLVIGFAAETDDVLENAKKKRKRKAADWIIANDVSGDVMGGDENEVHIVSGDGVESLDQMAKPEVAMELAKRIAQTLTAEAAE